MIEKRIFKEEFLPYTPLPSNFIIFFSGSIRSCSEGIHAGTFST